MQKLVSGTNDFGKIRNNQQVKGLAFAIHCGNVKIDDFPFSVDNVLSLGRDDNITLPKLDPDDVCMVMQTSGTTGNHKLVPKTHIETINVSLANNIVLDLRQSDVFFNPSPFTWVGGYISMNLFIGFTRVTIESFMSLGTTETIANTFIGIIEKEKCNVAMVMASILYDMMNANLGKQFPLKTIIVGGYPMQKSIAEAVDRVTKRLVIFYGGTEFNTISGKLIVKKGDLMDYNTGPPNPGVEVKIVDNTGKLLPRNKTGTIHIRSRWRFPGYLNNDKDTKDVLKLSGWINTDDVGYVTGDGEIISMGRQKDVIDVNGALISPYSIEKIIIEHKDVKSVVVIAVPDEITYQQMCACVIRKPGSSVSWKDIEDMYSDKTIAKDGSMAKTIFFPRYHVFLDSFPVTITGKVMRNELAVNAIKLLKLKGSVQTNK